MAIAINQERVSDALAIMQENNVVVYPKGPYDTFPPPQQKPAWNTKEITSVSLGNDAQQLRDLARTFGRLANKKLDDGRNFLVSGCTYTGYSLAFGAYAFFAHWKRQVITPVDTQKIQENAKALCASEIKQEDTATVHKFHSGETKAIALNRTAQELQTAITTCAAQKYPALVEDHKSVDSFDVGISLLLAGIAAWRFYQGHRHQLHAQWLATQGTIAYQAKKFARTKMREAAQASGAAASAALSPNA
jgi:hypothetical protein